MRARRLLPLIIIAIILPLALLSCEGIGDGALIGNAAVSDGSDLSAMLTFFDASGSNISMECHIEDEAVAEELYEMLLHGEYVEGLDRVSMDMPYIEVIFHRRTNIESGRVGEYRIYFDGYVLQETSSGTVQKGHLGGVYEKLTAYIPEEITLELSKSAEAEAGFSFNSLMIATEPGKTYTVSDFPEIDCISVKSLMSTGETSWWVLTLDSDTKEEILDSLEKLKARGDILSVELDYIMTLD